MVEGEFSVLEAGGERHFRCAAGHGCYVRKEDVEVVRVGRSGGGGRRGSPAQGVPFDLDTSLAELVGIATAKAELKSLRNRLEVGRKRAVFGGLSPLSRGHPLP